jgi:hypothetical protein
MKWDVDKTIEFDNAPNIVLWACVCKSSSELLCVSKTVRCVIATVCECIKPTVYRDGDVIEAVILESLPINKLREFVDSECYLRSADGSVDWVSCTLRDDIFNQLYFEPLMRMQATLIFCNSCSKNIMIVHSTPSDSLICPCGGVKPRVDHQPEFVFAYAKNQVGCVRLVDNIYEELSELVFSDILRNKFDVVYVRDAPTFDTGIGEFKVVMCDIPLNSMGSVILVPANTQFMALRTVYDFGYVQKITAAFGAKSVKDMQEWIWHGNSRPAYRRNFFDETTTFLYSSDKPVPYDQIKVVMKTLGLTRD